MDYSMSFRTGSQIGDKFEIIKKVGEGSLGDDVYLGKQLNLKRDVTIRILPREVSKDKEMVQRFKQAIELTASLQHPNILPAYEAGQHMNRAYLVTASESGEFLNTKLEKEGALKWLDALNIIIPIAEALEFVWSQKHVLHRNIRPETILINPQNQPLLADFGMAKSRAEQSMDLTMVGFTIGHPEYMSPEQVRGESDLDCRSDIYCLGLVFYEILAGLPAYKATSQIDLMEAQLKEVLKPISELKPDVTKNCSDLIEKMLKKERDERYADWKTLIKELKKLKRNKKRVPSKKEKDDNAEENNPLEEATKVIKHPKPSKYVKPKLKEEKAPTTSSAPPASKAPISSGNNTTLVVAVSAVLIIAFVALIAFVAFIVVS